MTFYLLAADQEDSRQRFVCKLAGEFCYDQSRTHIFVPNQDYLQELDKMLWLHPSDRFVPHEILAGTSATCLVTLSNNEQFDGAGDVLINTTSEIPAMASQFSKTCEIVLDKEKPGARERFRQYRSRNFELFHEFHDELADSSRGRVESSLEET